MTVLNPGQMPGIGHALESRVRTWMVRLILAALLATVTLIVGGGVQAVLNVPDLQPWHRLIPDAEVRAADLDDRFTLQQYLAREAAVFDQVRDEVETPVSRSGSQTEANRYQSASISSPRRASRDWNRTFELTPTGAMRGGALLIHGLTDSPYSMRSIANTLQAQGYYALALRVPGHGTVPGALTQATAEDWMAAVRMGARHVRQTIGADRPMVLVGYSNGGALVMRYTLEATADARLPSPARVVLISPMIGVSPLARMARVISALGPLPFFEKARWLDVIPEYNPFKYNSFPANAANQSYRVSSLLRTEIADASRSGLLDRLPPILAFQSVVDATVSTPAVVDLFDRLHGNGHELVIFDINRRAGLEPYLRPTDAALVRSLAAPGPRLYRRTLITNVTAEVSEVRARSIAAGATTIEDVPLGLYWPMQMFSLSHVALMFAIDDPVYGSEPPEAATPSIALGRLSPRGEKGVLTVPVETLMRIGWNPFLPFLLGRVVEWTDPGAGNAEHAPGGQPTAPVSLRAAH